MIHQLPLKVIYHNKYNFVDEYGEKDSPFNSDELVDSAEVVDKVGDVTDCYHGSGKVTKEILEVGRGSTKPILGSLVRIKYIAYFYDKEMFDRTPEGQTLDMYLGDIRSIEGLWRGI